MADVYVTMATVGSFGQQGNAVDVMQAKGLRSEVITSSGTSAAGTEVAGKKTFAKIVCATAVYATAGENPTATAANGVYIAGGLPEYLALDEGDRIAVIDV